MTERDTGSTAYESGIEYYTREAEDTLDSLRELGQPDLENWSEDKKYNYVGLLEKYEDTKQKQKNLQRRYTLGLLK